MTVIGAGRVAGFKVAMEDAIESPGSSRRVSSVNLDPVFRAEPAGRSLSCWESLPKSRRFSLVVDVATTLSLLGQGASVDVPG